MRERGGLDRDSRHRAAEHAELRAAHDRVRRAEVLDDRATL